MRALMPPPEIPSNVNAREDGIPSGRGSLIAKAARWRMLFPPASSAATDDGLDAAKIAAMGLMAVNHVLMAFPPPWPYWGYLIGRPCIPIFAYILAVRLAQGPLERNSRILLRLFVWGVVAQPIYYALVGALTLRLNILFTLAAGTGLVFLLRKQLYLPLVAGALILLIGYLWIDGGAFVPMGIVFAYALYERSPNAALAAVAFAAAAAILLAGGSAGALAVLGAPLLILLSPRCASFVPRVPGWVFYVFYPAHLAAIWIIFGPYQ
jgi:hypothetical protein